MNHFKNKNKEINRKLVKLRQKVDILDDHLWLDLKERYQLVEEIVKLKKDTQMKMTDLEREKKILQRIQHKFPELDIQFITKIYQLIFEHSKELYSKNRIREL